MGKVYIGCGCLTIAFIVYLILYGIGYACLQWPRDRASEEAKKEYLEVKEMLAKEEEKRKADDPNPTIKEPTTDDTEAFGNLPIYRPKFGTPIQEAWKNVLAFHHVKDCNAPLFKPIEMDRVNIGFGRDDFYLYDDIGDIYTIGVVFKEGCRISENLNRILYKFADKSGATESNPKDVSDNFVLIEISMWFDGGYMYDKGIFERLTKLLAQKYGEPNIGKQFEHGSGWDIHTARYVLKSGSRCVLAVGKGSCVIRKIYKLTDEIAAKRVAAEKNRLLNEKKSQEAVIRGF